MYFPDDAAKKLSHRQKKRAVKRLQRKEQRLAKIKEQKLNEVDKVKKEDVKVKVEKKGFSDDNKLWLKPKQVKVESSDEGRNLFCTLHVISQLEFSLST